MQKWAIKIESPFGGFAPAYFDDDFPTVGNKNMAGKMQNIDLTNPNFLTQGSGLLTLTNGDQTGVVNTLIKGMIDYIVASNTTYGVGGNKLYKIQSDTVVSDVNFPHTINHPTLTDESGEDVKYFQGNIYYSYNANTAGDIGQLNLTTNIFDDDWASTVPTGMAALQKGVPHPMIVAGNDCLYIGNKNYITSWDGITFIEKDLDLPSDCIVQDLEWYLNNLFIAVNRVDVVGGSKNSASIYVWNGNAVSWDDEIEVRGEIKSLYQKNNVLYVFWQDISGKSRIAVLDGSILRNIAIFDGSLPNFYQITDYKNFILWVSDGLIYAWGARDGNLSPILFQIADGGYSTVGGLATPFGTPLVASTESVNYKLTKFNNYDTNCYWKSLLFPVLGEEDDKESQIDKIIVNFKTLTTSAKCNITLNMNEGTSSWTDTISFATDGAIIQKIFYPNRRCKNFRIELDFSNGSAINSVKIKSIYCFGHTLK